MNKINKPNYNYRLGYKEKVKSRIKHKILLLNRELNETEKDIHFLKEKIFEDEQKKED